MADLESVRKRPRDHSEEEGEVLLPPATAAKRPCSTSSSSYDTILDFLDSDDENLPEDVSSLISSLQEELSETLPSPAGAGPAGEGGRVELSSSDSAGEEVIRRLVEASDDELGIPAGLEAEEEEEEFVGREVGEISNYDVFWELEEEAANHYMLQSELFMA